MLPRFLRRLCRVVLLFLKLCEQMLFNILPPFSDVCPPLWALMRALLLCVLLKPAVWGVGAQGQHHCLIAFKKKFSFPVSPFGLSSLVSGSLKDDIPWVVLLSPAEVF